MNTTFRLLLMLMVVLTPLLAACRRAVPSDAAPPAAAVSERATPSIPAPGGPDGYALRPAESAAVAAFLRAHADLRAATDEDRRPSLDGDDVASLYGLYHPYFVRGDVNDDAVLDFVLAFVRGGPDEETPWFSIVVFAGDSRGGFGSGVFLERDISLADGDLSLDRDSIVVTPDIADESTRRYRWDPERGRHVFVHDAPEEAPSPPAAQI
jgi:hypothetical protein